MVKEKIPTEVESEVKPEVVFLRDVSRTRILFNTDDFFCENIDYKGDFGSMDMDRLRLTLRGLSDIVKMVSHNEIGLTELMSDYKFVSEYWNKSLKRSYSFDIHNYEEDRDKEKKERIFDILDYFYAPEDEKEILMAKVSSKKTRDIYKDTDVISEMCSEYAVPILILLTIKILSSFVASKGDVKDIDSDCEKLFAFLKEYEKRLGKVALSVIFESVINENNKQYKSVIANENHDSSSSMLTRLKLICLAKNCLFFANRKTEAKLQMGQKWLFPELNGIWRESDKESTNFWKIEKVVEENVSYYDFNYYCYDSKTKELTRTKFGATFQNKDGIEFWIYHPLMDNSLIQNHIHEDLFVIASVKWEKVKTHSWNEDSPKDITKLSFEPKFNKGHWFKVKNLYKVEKDKHYYQDLIKKCFCINLYEKENYESRSGIVAITRDFLYFPLDYDIMKLMGIEHNENSVIYLKVPKSLNNVLNSITLKNHVRLVSSGNGCFLSVAEFFLFKEITTEEMRNKLNITITDSIT